MANRIPVLYVSGSVDSDTYGALCQRTFAFPHPKQDFKVYGALPYRAGRQDGRIHASPRLQKLIEQTCRIQSPLSIAEQEREIAASPATWEAIEKAASVIRRYKKMDKLPHCFKTRICEVKRCSSFSHENRVCPFAHSVFEKLAFGTARDRGFLSIQCRNNDTPWQAAQCRFAHPGHLIQQRKDGKRCWSILEPSNPVPQPVATPDHAGVKHVQVVPQHVETLLREALSPRGPLASWGDKEGAPRISKEGNFNGTFGSMRGYFSPYHKQRAPGPRPDSKSPDSLDERVEFVL